jgi:hypothetical protein
MGPSPGQDMDAESHFWDGALDRQPTKAATLASASASAWRVQDVAHWSEREQSRSGNLGPYVEIEAVGRAVLPGRRNHLVLESEDSWSAVGERGVSRRRGQFGHSRSFGRARIRCDCHTSSRGCHRRAPFDDRFLRLVLRSRDGGPVRCHSLRCTSLRPHNRCTSKLTRNRISRAVGQSLVQAPLGMCTRVRLGAGANVPLTLLYPRIVPGHRRCNQRGAPLHRVRCLQVF